MKENILYSKTLNFRARVAPDSGSFAGNATRGVSQPSLGGFLLVIAILVTAVSTFGIQKASAEECLAREGAKSILNEADRSTYERRLFVTPDEVARYMFLTNRYDDGDRSAAVYRAPSKKGALPGDYWLTVTEAAGSLTAETRNILVQRHDAPLPSSAAQALHQLWLAVLKQSRTNKNAVPCAPTGVFSVTPPSGARLSAVTVSLGQDSLCIALMNVGESLVEYGKLPATRRTEAAGKIEKDARHLLKRVNRKQ
jgi:hypothetical protein